ncbi:uncharacterized protein LOC119738727 [Patiria miniata]|uniref:Uncharacterized protein n=1 Tax=Patiria miniata TaxID=46514 RepID=A0A914AZL1_PATMI|nr:uncharacterized protein LOC119737668 [Patiria miniata]XP_038069590.1 uncharacterized protein LOC119738727 [Patiria miniata]
MKSVIVFLAVFAMTSLKTEAVIKNCPQWTTYNEDTSVYSVCMSAKNLYYHVGKGFCESHGGVLCSLKQLAKLYELGARDERWGLTSDTERDARMMPCDDYPMCECFNNAAAQPYFPNTPRPPSRQQVYCCKFL